MSMNLVSNNSAFIQHSTDVKLFKELVDEMTAPINLNGLNEDITLIPCAHKIQAIALKAQGKDAQGESVCPQCKIAITGYLTKDQAKSVYSKFSKMSEEFKIKHKLSKPKNELSSDNPKISDPNGY